MQEKVVETLGIVGLLAQTERNGWLQETLKTNGNRFRLNLDFRNKVSKHM
jgi:hypothetical protein